MKIKNWFTRVLVVLLILFIGVLICFSYFGTNPRLNLTPEIIVLVLLLIVLTLAEVFDNFSIGNIISLKREKDTVKKELVASKEENERLRNQITTIISTSISSRNTNIIGIAGDSLSKLSVEPAQSSEVEQKNNEDALNNVSNESNRNYAVARETNRQIEEFVLKRFCKNNQIAESSLDREVKFSKEFVDSDPIMDRNMVFDAYYRTIQCEYFIEIKSGSVSPNYYYMLYHLLSKIYHYRVSKQKQAKLLFVLPIISEKSKARLYMHSYPGQSIERLKELFSPAIKNDLLELVQIEVSDEEVNDIYTACNSKK